MNRLIEIGFFHVGNWFLTNENGLDFNVNPYNNVNHLLYMFITDETIMYIGKTRLTLQTRMNQYKNPGAGQQTNIRIKELIFNSLINGRKVDIYILVDPGLLCYGGFKVSLPSGLEDTLINEFQPAWNLHGKKVNNTKKVKNIVHAFDNNEGEPIASFELTLRETYIDQGFLNIPKTYSELFAHHLAKIEITLGNNEAFIMGTINRTANINATPRIMGYTALRDWFNTNNMHVDDRLLIEVITPTRISITIPQPH